MCGVPVVLKDFLPSKKGWSNSHGGVKSLIRIDPEESMFTRAAEKAGAQWFIVEQDTCAKNPFDSLKDSFDYLKENFVRG